MYPGNPTSWKDVKVLFIFWQRQRTFTTWWWDSGRGAARPSGWWLRGGGWLWLGGCPTTRPPPCCPPPPPSMPGYLVVTLVKVGISNTMCRLLGLVGSRGRAAQLLITLQLKCSGSLLGVTCFFNLCDHETVSSLTSIYFTVKEKEHIGSSYCPLLSANKDVPSSYSCSNQTL